MDRLLKDLLNAINDAGTIMNERELCDLAYGVYGTTEYLEDDDGNILDSRRIYTREGLQEIADIYTDGFDAIKWWAPLK